MKKNIALLLTIVFAVFTNLVAQHTEGGTVGFSCSFVGRPSFSVLKMSKLASHAKFNRIRRKLVKGSTAEKYLAIILCETLVARNKIVLTDAELKIIEDSYGSSTKISICQGCTMFQTVSISELLAQISSNHIGGRARKWAKRVTR